MLLVRGLTGSAEESGTVNDKGLRVLASVGLAVGGVFGMAGVFVPSASLRGLAWGIDGVGLVMAGALLTVAFYRRGQDLVASGFLVFTVGEGIILSSAAMDLAVSVPSFGRGPACGPWRLCSSAFPACSLSRCAFSDSSPHSSSGPPPGRSSRALKSCQRRPPCPSSPIQCSQQRWSAGFGHL